MSGRQFLLMNMPDCSPWEGGRPSVKSVESVSSVIQTGAGLRRGELEIDLSRDQFDALWPVTETRRLEKARFELRHEGHVIELDIYRGKLAGLQVAEVEFESEEESAAFTPPAWFGRE